MNGIPTLVNEYYLDLGLLSLLISKMRTKLGTFVRDAASNILYGRNKESIRQIKGTKTGKVLVLASGPSLRESIPKWRQIPGNESAAIFGINNQILHEEELGITFTHYVLADPFYFVDFSFESAWKQSGYSKNYTKEDYEAERAGYAKVTEMIAQREIECFVPYWARNSQVIKENRNIKFFCDRTRTSSKNLLDPTRTLGLRSLSAYMSLVIANYLGYSEIFIAGFDNNTWKTLSRNPASGSLEYEYTHFYEEAASYTERNLGKVLTSEILASASSIHRLHERMFDEINFHNLNSSSLSL